MQLALTFDEADHAYTLGGVRIPSVTQVLSHGQDLSRIPAWTALRGTAFHLATEYDDAGDLDESSVDELVRPHLEAYRKWKAATKPVFTHTEVRVWGELDGLKFAGTVDRVIGAMTVADLKSGAPRKEHGAQLHAYGIALAQSLGVEPRYFKGVYCTKDAAFVEKPYDGREHLEHFRTKLHKFYEEEKNA